MPTVSYAITVCHELLELTSLLDNLIEKIDSSSDEIVILVDSENSTEEIKNKVRDYEKQFSNVIKSFSHSLSGNFAKHKNFLNSKCTKEYIFQIDADEFPNCVLLNNLQYILSQNTDIELYYVPRINIVKGITDEHIKKWSWKLNNYGWVNFPDYQPRIYKNKKEVKWRGKVHERIIGVMNYSVLPAMAEYSLYHKKVIERQVEQNKMYDKIVGT